MTQFHHPVNEEKSYRRALFLFASLALAGACSIYPVMCFKAHSSKERKDTAVEIAKASLPLTPPHSSCSASASSPTSLVLSTTSPPESAQATIRPSRDGLGQRRSSLGEDARLRPRHRSRSPSTPPRSPATKKVPPQLLGGRAGSDADVLKIDNLKRLCSSDSETPLSSAIEYHNANYEATAARLRNLLSPDCSQKHESGTGKEQHQKEGDSPPKTPSPSSSAKTNRTADSSTSNASSFAFLVSNTRSDTRLFKPRSQPLAHLKKQTPLERRPVEKRRGSSYYKPKVVEDSAVIKVTIPHNLRGSMSLSMADFIKAGKIGQSKPPDHMPLSRFHDGSVRHSSSMHSSRASRSVSPVPRFPNTQVAPRKSLLLRVSTSKGFIQAPSLARKSDPARPQRERSRSREPHDSTKRQPLSPPTSLPSVVDRPHAQEHHHCVTPPEADPGSPAHHRFVHGDHYFRTFGNDTMNTKEAIPSLVPPEKPSPASNQSAKIAWRIPGGRNKSIGSKPEQRKRSSVFKLRRKTAILEGDRELPGTGVTSVRPALEKDTPGISLTTPADAELQRRHLVTSSSEHTLPNYFAQPRRRDHSSTASSPARSPGVSASLRPRGAHRRPTSSDESSQLSPFTIPRRPRLYNARTLESIVDADPTPAGSSVTSQNHVKQDIGLRQLKSSKQSSPHLSAKFKAGSSKQEAGMSVEEQSMVATMPKRVETAKRVVFDSRELQPEYSSSTLRRSAEAKEKRGLSLASMTSLSSLVRAMAPRPVQNKLKRKSSQATVTSMASSKLAPLPPRRNLEVTGS
ncbi:hypothetical protein LTR78_008036 [Recurvomyces mirabilis]|uniref:Uncharacterized protein n=1 Tax=Recurvomyces mirabilis TaxID=574656 RepID=A0AAE0TRA6_9PEZI|nr:hypothetical protein LTR78_008036 [Recurvomyces mirabilis]KAK5150764.1 hypothetical protein LTS14_009827 [Recurvomyces mirabilis]